MGRIGKMLSKTVRNGDTDLVNPTCQLSLLYSYRRESQDRPPRSHNCFMVKWLSTKLVEGAGRIMAAYLHTKTVMLASQLQRKTFSSSAQVCTCNRLAMTVP